MFVDHLHADPTADVKKLTNKQYVHVYLITLAHHLDAILNALSVQNVQGIKLV